MDPVKSQQPALQEKFYLVFHMGSPHEKSKDLKIWYLQQEIFNDIG